MKFYRSKSNFMFGCVVFGTIFLLNIPAIITLAPHTNVPPYIIILLILLFVAGAAIFLVGMQQIVIDNKGVSVKILKIPVKELSWENIVEAGIGKSKINKQTYMKQLYVSKKALKEEEYEDLDKLRFSESVIWFDYNQNSEEKIRYYLTQKNNES